MLAEHLARGTGPAAARIRGAFGRDGFGAVVVMGSGWAAAADLLGETRAEIPVADLPGVSPPVADGHVPVLRHVRTAAGRELLV